MPLDSDPDLVWSKLTEQEKRQFHDMYQSGTLAALVEATPPWWEVTSFEYYLWSNISQGTQNTIN